ncbi:MAG TPA: DNA polymerase III subunit alpha [Chitinophagaceae bacterium]|nr:DNA polymerase III subunit alpha [Chitinophagaceae bacterium]
MLLNCHTYYSLCYGTYSVDTLLDEVERHGYPTAALTDINNTSACLDFVRMAKQRQLKPILGIDFRNGTQACYVGIARNNIGFRELNHHLSIHLHHQHAFEPIAPDMHDVYIIYPLASYRGWPLRDHEYIGISLKELPGLPFSPIKHQLHKLVALQTVSFAGKAQFNAHRLLRAIDTNTLLSKLPLSEQGLPSDTMPSRQALYDAYADYPAIIQQTEALLHDCHIDFEYGKLSNKNLRFYTDSAAHDAELLRRECMRGLPYRYPHPTPEVMQRLEKELDIISQLNFASYFLINWDIITYARSKNYYYVGRGSGANSIIAYLLRITDVDPIELDLYFERFINLYRNNAPDFDMDFSWTDRDDITRYIFERFGYERTALLGSYTTFQHDAVIRELGKVFGLPAADIDRLQHAHRHPPPDELGQLVLRYSKLIHGFPSHLSIHASGILISEEPIYTYSATFMPPKGFPTTQFSMLEAEDIGLYKFDILSQRGLGKIKDTLQIVKENRGDDIDIHAIAQFKQDEAVKALLRKGRTIGCFYVESPAMRMLLTKLRADDYLRLVAASSIIRPGVAKSGMMREYIIRYRDESLRTKAREQLPELYDLLHETYGVMVYQEDVIKIAHFFAGLSLAEADYLRRGMSWKFKQRNEFSAVQDNFFKNCRAKGYAENLIRDIWIQIESFANFAFSKGHSASYAVESYQALFLKAYYPLEYMVATLNNGGGFYRKELYIHEARMQGATIVAPCVNHSMAHSVIEGRTIYLGLHMISELETESIRKLLYNRHCQGPFLDLNDVVQRVPLSIEQMRLLIRAGALQFTGRNKKELLWDVHALMPSVSKQRQHETLFMPEVTKWQLPELYHSPIDDAFDEIELLGFSLNSPFHLLRDPIPSEVKASDLVNYLYQEVCIVGYMITVKTTRTSKGDLMHFGTFIDTAGDWIDTVHFPPSAKQYPFMGPGCYQLEGKVVSEYDFISIEVARMQRLPMIDREDQSTTHRQLMQKVVA